MADNRTNYAVGHGLAIAEDPLGPYKKHYLNPVMQSGHETTYWPYKGGVATWQSKMETNVKPYSMLKTE